MPELSTILIALGLTALAGLSTGIGALISFFTRSTDTRMLAGALGLSAGVMVYISFMELMPQAVESLEAIYSDRVATSIMLAAFFGGIGLIAAIDYLVPEDENPHETHTMNELERSDSHHKLKRTGTMLALAIGIHNFPEGMATFISCLDGLEVALPIMVAIAIHNIPEGLLSPSRSIIPQSTAARHCATRSYRVSPNRPGRLSAWLFFFLSGLRWSMPSVLPLWPESWCI